MCTLIDVDPNEDTDKIAALSVLQPHRGFQYLNTFTYWPATTIVGKVLAPTARSIAGWVGPCKPTEHLDGSQNVKIRSHRRLPQRMRADDMALMSGGTDPLGPPADLYPVQDYALVPPELDRPVTSIKLTQLAFKAINPTDSEAAFRFSYKGTPIDLRLKYDVWFISAFPCSEGPHPLFLDYTHRLIRVDEIMHIQNWGGLHDDPKAGQPPAEDIEDREKVLAIEAYGARDNEVFARAWCAHWGLSAVVADIRRTWYVEILSCLWCYAFVLFSLVSYLHG